MRLKYRNSCIEYFIFKGICFQQNQSRYCKEKKQLIEKYFKKYKNDEMDNIKDLKKLIKENVTQELKSEPKLIYVTKEEQIEDLLIFLDEYFDIKIDKRNRFYRKYKITKNGSLLKLKTEYYSWQEILMLYNKNNTKNSYLKRRYNEIKVLTKEYKKRFLYLTLIKTKKGFHATKEPLIQLPY